jgi:hypothetical protein
MKTTLKAIALGAVVATSGAVAASAMEQEFNMLTGAVYNALKQQGFDTTNIDTLTLAEIAEIKNLLEGNDMGNAGRSRINNILDN